MSFFYFKLAKNSPIIQTSFVYEVTHQYVHDNSNIKSCLFPSSMMSREDYAIAADFARFRWAYKKDSWFQVA